MAHRWARARRPAPAGPLARRSGRGPASLRGNFLLARSEQKFTLANILALVPRARTFAQGRKVSALVPRAGTFLVRRPLTLLHCRRRPNLESELLNSPRGTSGGSSLAARGSVLEFQGPWGGGWRASALQRSRRGMPCPDPRSCRCCSAAARSRRPEGGGPPALVPRAGTPPGAAAPFWGWQYPGWGGGRCMPAPSGRWLLPPHRARSGPPPRRRGAPARAPRKKIATRRACTGPPLPAATPQVAGGQPLWGPAPPGARSRTRGERQARRSPESKAAVSAGVAAGAGRFPALPAAPLPGREGGMLPPPPAAGAPDGRSLAGRRYISPLPERRHSFRTVPELAPPLGVCSSHKNLSERSGAPPGLKPGGVPRRARGLRPGLRRAASTNAA